jgi:4-hydroxybenzoate polyprenyltransferase
MRPQQWVKNVLVFAPLFLAHAYTSPSKVVAAIIAFVAFCACASAAYVLNDLFDADADRQHPAKRHRPIASGELPEKHAPPLAASLLVMAGSLAVAFLPWPFAAVLAIYFMVTLSYSFWLKSKMLLDVVALASLYSLRILAGSAATDIPVSQWLLAFSTLLFLSLALVKRCSELARMVNE